MNHKTNSDELWQEPTFQCKYCGKQIKSEMDYCSDECMKKDAVWHYLD